MILRNSGELTPVEWGNGTSIRLLTESDGMGYSVCETRVRKGSNSAMQYRRHLEACYCVEGSGEILTEDGTRHKITAGMMYALDEHDAHHLIASDEQDMRLISVFAPALRGDERHTLSAAGYSQY